MIYFSLQSVGFLIGNVEFGLEIDYGGRGGGQESQFHSLFFMQAAVIAGDICTTKRHSNLSVKRNIYFYESSIIYLHYNCLLYVQVFVHEAIHHTELNIYFNNQHLLINISIILTLNFNPLTPKNCDHIINMHLKARWKIFTSLLTLKPLRVTDF